MTVERQGLTALEAEAVRKLDACDTWLATTVTEATRPEWRPNLAAWREEVGRLRASMSRHETIRIAMVGTTGAGKSSLLNAVLGAEVLPVGVMEPCTAFVTRVQRSEDHQFHAQISYCSVDEWEREIGRLQSAFGVGENGTGVDAVDGESNHLRRAAEKRLRAVYGKDVDLAQPVGKLFGELLPDDAVRVLDLDGPEQSRFESAKEMLTHIKRLVRGESRVWPLVKEVVIHGPFDKLPRGLEIVDLPGLNDPNEARIDVTRGYLQSCSNVWVTFNMVRGLTDDIHRVLRDERVFQRMVLNGTYHGISLIGTHADNVDANVADQLGLPEDAPHTLLVRAYCELTKQKAREQLRSIVCELGQSTQDEQTVQRMLEVVDQLPVHTTSSDEYRRMRKIGRTNKPHLLESEEATGIPGLHDLLAQIALKSDAGLRARATAAQVSRLVEEVRLFFRAKGRPAGARMEKFQRHIAGQLVEFERRVAVERDAATQRIRDREKAFLDRLAGLLDATLRSAQKLTGLWSGIHWATLRAVVHRDGAFRSSSGRNYDLSSEVANCLVQHLPVAWERFFTDELGVIMQEYGVRMTEKGESFCTLVGQALELCLGSKVGLEQSEHWFRERVRLLIEESGNRVVAQVRERRRELVDGIDVAARQRMRPIYVTCQREQGPGMKKRILDHLLPAAQAAVQPLFETMRQDLVSGLTELQSAIVGILQQVSKTTVEKGKAMAHNCAIDADQAVDSTIATVLESRPLAP